MFTESCEPLISALDHFEVSQTMLDQSQSHTMEEVKRVSDVFNESLSRSVAHAFSLFQESVRTSYAELNEFINCPFRFDCVQNSADQAKLLMFPMPDGIESYALFLTE